MVEVIKRILHRKTHLMLLESIRLFEDFLLLFVSGAFGSLRLGALDLNSYILIS